MNNITIPNNINELNTTKEKVLSLLKSNESIYVSGQDIADILFLTRAGVWKAIKSLRADGEIIEAVSNRGYRLNNEGIDIDASLIKTRLSANVPKHFKIYTYDEVTSTNDVVRVISNSEGIYDFIVISNSQTNGRGRRGRSFFSPKGTGIYFSMLLKPNFSFEDASLLTCLSAVALCDAITEVTDIEPSIKWVNDIFCQDKKVAGILTEANTSIEDGHLESVIIGIGINLIDPQNGFPSDIKNTATSLLNKGALPEDVKNRLCASFINHFYSYYNNMNEHTFIKKYIDLSFLIGKHIKINSFENTNDLTKKQGTAKDNYALVLGINEKCHLLVEYEDGHKASLKNGEVSVVEY